MLLAIGITTAGCDSSDTESISGTEQLAVRVVNTGSGNLDILHATNWCYDPGECAIPPTASLGSGGGSAIVFPSQSMILYVSASGQTARGVGVRFEVQAGSGRVEILEGRLDSEWEDDFEGTVVHSRDLSAGATTMFSFNR